MRKCFILLISFAFILRGFCQTTPALNLPKDAKVEGTIVDMRSRQPQNNELIVFRSQKNNNEYQVISNADGKFATRLPAGDKYDIFIMGFKDSISQNVMNIPALGPNSFYKDPFKVNLEFDPPKTFVLDNVEFDFGKSTLRPQSYQSLDDLVDYLKRKPNERIEIGGHTDNVGTDAKNLVLSLERAKSIVSYLIAKGIDNSRLVAKGYGADEPIEENNTEEGRQKNRRTEVKILE
ncbi:MAG: OmpA family protein [Bacteroidota bacterium]|nr:OmpA family protein [Bacteroidota bacterium]